MPFITGMRELNRFHDLLEPKAERNVSIRSIESRIIAASRGHEFYDGKRENGYGGYIDDGRWDRIAAEFVEEYGLTKNSTVLQIGCHKGFLLKAFHKMGIWVRGTEVSRYAVECSDQAVGPMIHFAKPTDLPFDSARFDLVISISPVYQLPLEGAIESLMEIRRVSKGRSFITLGSYETEEDYWLYKQWTVLAATVLKKDEWVKVLAHSLFTGDYMFSNAASLGLKRG